LKYGKNKSIDKFFFCISGRVKKIFGLIHIKPDVHFLILQLCCINENAFAIFILILNNKNAEGKNKYDYPNRVFGIGENYFA